MYRKARKLAGQIDRGGIESFGGLLDRVSARRDDLSPTMRTIHADVAAAFAAGDPTPFKKFRRAEYQETIARMAESEAAADVDDLLGVILVSFAPSGQLRRC